MCYGIGGAEGGSGKSAVRPAPRVSVRRRRPLRFGPSAARLGELAAEARSLREAALAERARRVAELQASAAQSGDVDDPLHWSILYDLEMAPTTTGRAILLEQRIVPVPPQDLAEDGDLHDELWTVIEALAAAGVFLVNTDHLGDRDLYGRLYYRILDEPTRSLPPDGEAAEFIDCLHPMDVEAGEVGRRILERGGTVPPTVGPPPEDGRRGPFNRGPVADRDRWLPRPRW